MTVVVKTLSPCSVIETRALDQTERWPEDVSEAVDGEIQHRCRLQLSGVLLHLQEFVDRHAAQDMRQFSLHLVSLRG